MIKKITFWIVVVGLFIGLSFLANVGFGELTKAIKPNPFSKPLVEEENAQSKKVGHVTFKYKNNNEKTSVAFDAVLSTLNENQSLLKELFGKNLNSPLSIVLANDLSKLNDRFGNLAEGHIAGYYVAEKSSIYIATPKDETELKQFKQTIVHEYTHHLISSTLKNSSVRFSDLPVWFHEGLAEYVERKNQGITSDDIEETETVGFKELGTHKQWDKHLRSPYNPYLQSSVLIGLLVKNKGAAAINKIIEGCKKDDFYAVFEKEAGQSFSSYEFETMKKLKEFPLKIITARGELYQQKNPHKALATASELNDTIPNVNEVMLLIAQIYSELGDYEKSLQYYERTVYLFPYSSYYLQLANAYLFLDLDKAIEAAENSVEMANSEDVEFYEDYLVELKNLRVMVKDGDPLLGYLHFLRKDSSLTDKNKDHLITIILERYPSVSEGRKELILLKQNSN
ncbi:hypothetical protein DRW41_08850 [Neobacillus piezotolerans]|uniref:Uncharacterized protein n=1 Tax=Neobacillus piezotolerans TaxID=2259171 RepID=A0A3D8GTX4_9BACI|nr:DUF2268 domain-containing putative Zn-dependent protease [Neobacillus piezotolerans]RDU37908.1 hypothetical protein DRW41_08850 [Neobacillus piezotolerans]